MPGHDKTFNQQRDWEVERLWRYRFDRQVDLCQAVKKRPNLKQIVDPDPVNPMTLRLLMLDDAYRALEELEASLPQVLLYPQPNAIAISGQNVCSNPFGSPAPMPTASGTQPAIVPISSPEPTTLPNPGDEGYSMPIVSHQQINLVWSERPRAAKFLMEYLFHFGSVLDRLAYEVTELYRPPQEGNWPKGRQLGWGNVEIKQTMEKFVDDAVLENARQALEYRNRAVHDGYLIVDIGRKDDGRISLKIAPNRFAAVDSPPFPPNDVWLMDKVQTWTESLYEICNRIYDITCQKIKSGEEDKLSLP